jgi:hypothetical protein
LVSHGGSKKTQVWGYRFETITALSEDRISDSHEVLLYVKGVDDAHVRRGSTSELSTTAINYADIGHGSSGRVVWKR